MLFVSFHKIFNCYISFFGGSWEYIWLSIALIVPASLCDFFNCIKVKITKTVVSWPTNFDFLLLPTKINLNILHDGINGVS